MQNINNMQKITQSITIKEKELSTLNFLLSKNFKPLKLQIIVTDSKGNPSYVEILSFDEDFLSWSVKENDICLNLGNRFQYKGCSSFYEKPQSMFLRNYNANDHQNYKLLKLYNLQKIPLHVTVNLFGVECGMDEVFVNNRGSKGTTFQVQNDSYRHLFRHFVFNSETNLTQIKCVPDKFGIGKAKTLQIHCYDENFKKINLEITNVIIKGLSQRLESTNTFDYENPKILKWEKFGSGTSGCSLYFSNNNDEMYLTFTNINKIISYLGRGERYVYIKFEIDVDPPQLDLVPNLITKENKILEN